MNNDNQIRSEKIPSAWLVTGGRMFKDRAYISEAGAVKSAQERGDGASVEPLYLDDQLPVDTDALEQKEAVRKWVEDRRASDQLPPAPVAEELSSEPPAELIAEVRTSPIDGSPMLRVLEHRDFPDGVHKFYTHPQPAVPDVDALAEFIKNKYPISWEYGSRELAKQICNWIEEQKNDQ